MRDTGPLSRRTRIASVAALVTIALLATACSGKTFDRGASGNLGDPTKLAALPAVAGGTGPTAPVFPGSVISPDSGIATSIAPTITLPGETGAWTFVVKDLSDSPGGFSRSYATSGTSVRLPEGAGLVNGRAYQWTATSASKPGELRGGSFEVDVERVGVQQVDQTGGVSVGLSSGDGSVSWQSHAMSSMSGDIGFGLRFDTANAPMAGVPAGWALGASTAADFDHLIINADGVIGLVATNGSVSHYRKRADAYEPVRLSGVVQVTGSAPVLSANADGTWTVTTKEHTSVYGVADPTTGVADLLSVSSGGTPTLTQESSGGLLRSVGDPVSKRKVTFVYGGESGCSSPASGFVAAPKGMLCAVKFWDGSTATVSYVTLADGSVTIGRLTDFPEAGGDGASVSDCAYDALGRLARVRSPLVAAAAAANIIDANDPQFWTELTYDDSGRVASVTSPAASTGAARRVRTYDYGSSVTSVIDSFFGGQIARLAFQPSTFLPTASTDAAGLTATSEYEPGTSNVTRQVSRNGNVTQTTYKDGLADVTRGPTEGSLATDATVTKYSYDQSFASAGSDQATTLHGLDVTYWPNADWKGTDTTTELGPRLDGRLVSSMLVNWSSAPAGSGAWSARMTGVIRVKTEGRYTITAGGEAKVWVEGLACANDGCKDLPLTAGPHSIRVDVKSPQAEGSMNVQWSGPDSNGQSTSIPITALEPRYGRVTTMSNNDSVAIGATVETTSRNDYQDPSNGLLSSRWTQSGLTSSMQYEAREGAAGAWGRQTSSVLPAGNTVAMGFWGDTQSAKSACPDAKGANQGGQQKTLVAPGTDGTASGPTTTTWYDDAGRVVARSMSDGGTICYSFDKAGRTVTVRQLGGSEAMWSTVEFGVNGNPLVAMTTTHEGKDVTTSTAEVDLLGRTVRTVDRYGIVSTTTYDKRTGHPATVTVTAPGAAPIVTTSQYDASGHLVATVVDGRTLSTVTYAADGTLAKVAYGNGVVATLSVNANNRTDRVEWRNAAGATWSTSLVLDPGGRILGSSNAVGATTSTWNYTYDSARRLSAATLSDGLTKGGTWAWTYDANSNRLSQTTTGIAGAANYTYTYNGADQLVSTTDPAAAGGLEYDARGNATKVGPDTFTYDAFNDVLSATDGTTTIEYVRGMGGTVLERRETTSKGTSVLRPASGGLQLNAEAKPVSQRIPLPGGVTVTRWIGGTPSNQWVFNDLQGDRFVTTDDAGVISGAPQVYDPFGTRLSEAAVTPDGALPADWQGAGDSLTYQLRTPIVEMGMRVYVPALGRFVQHDPQMGGSANGYDFSNQDPINHDDPTGNSISDWFLFGIVLAVGIAVAAVTGGAAGPIVTGALWGAVAGAALYGIGEAVSEIRSGTDTFSWSTLGLYAGVSALIGAGGGWLGTDAVVVDAEMSVAGESAAETAATTSAAQVAEVQQVRVAVAEADDYFAFEATSWEHQPIVRGPLKNYEFTRVDPTTNVVEKYTIAKRNPALADLKLANSLAAQNKGRSVVRKTLSSRWALEVAQ